MFQRVRRSLTLKLILASAVPSAVVVLVGLYALIGYAERFGHGDKERAFDLLRQGLVVGALLGLGFAAVAVVVTMRRFLERPAQDLIDVMRRAEAGDVLVRAKVSGEDELGRIARSFNTMLGKITDMEVNEIEAARSMEAMQREVALQSELRAANDLLGVHLREMQLVLDVASALSGTLDLPEQLEELGQHVCARLAANEFSVLLLDEASHQLVVEAVAGEAPPSLRGLRLHLGEGVAGEAAAKGETLYVPDVDQDARHLHYKGPRKGGGAFLAVPLRAKGRVVGVMNLSRPVTNSFAPQEVKLAEAIAVHAGLAIANARLHAQTVELSFTDPLTGAANRRALFQRLEQEWTRTLRFGDELSLLMIDLDHFKAVNDEHGHGVGDAMLRAVANVLKRSVRKVDLVARYGGEEFCVVLPRVARPEALDVADKLRKAVEKTDFAGPDGKATLRMTISVGVAAHGVDANDVSALLEKSDQALYAAKHQGRNVVCVPPGASAPLLKGTGPS